MLVSSLDQGHGEHKLLNRTSIIHPQHDFLVPVHCVVEVHSHLDLPVRIRFYLHSVVLHL
jgi:hypothetical protein